MAYETILYQIDGRVATITLNRPEFLNAYTPQLGDELYAALGEAEVDKNVGAVILTGQGRAFCAGADVKGWDKEIKVKEGGAPAEALPGPLDFPTLREERSFRRMASMSKPIIAAINGVAVGVGASMLTSCDIRLISTTARIGFVFVKRGLTPEFGSSYMLPRLIGLAKAQELCLTGRIIPAEEALSIGLANKMYEPNALMGATRELAASIASGPPLAVALVRKGLIASLHSTPDQVLQYEHFAFDICRGSEDYKEGVRSFLEKREPKFTGR